jgi:hypothetical protein
MVRRFMFTTLFLMGTLVGCVSLPAVTSGQIGCAEKDITIIDDQEGLFTRTWTAECHGKRYFCSGHGGGNNSTPQVSCKAAEEAPPAAQTPPAAAGGCTSDAQCKGARICRSGVCVDP